ncbi:ACT domain-containing protein [Lactobacillus delbrueckii]|uniref:aspartate kinase n=1 Tax=Lactobacillus delbrueckii TaxID=1584 RepID=A0A4Q7DVW4_9LACO|nr:aspartate kinase [Lactobacillus delbrueckii]MCD5536590.1 aspartate kinase [Lactobacillus delbrueckii subsp. lactis]MCD5542935.1 aspartate kinase [Lactobacillus delbrueckii subsp. lactis]RZM16336.1 aspartate kinase [Lactobacillus delbrueckii]
MSKAVKFGGSSVANSEQFKKVRQIILADPDRKYVVTSACGKSGQEDHKVTDLLYLCAAHITYDVSYESIFQSIVNKYMEIKHSLGLKIDLTGEFARIRQNMAQNLNLDYLVSRGEYLTGLCLAEYLDADFVDSSRVIRFHYDGSIDLDKSQELLKAQVDPSPRVAIPGFYVADPRIIKDPVQIPRITYSELRQMSYMGANVLHDDAVFPVRQKNIPINVRNTNHPENPGTMIMNDCSELDAQEPPHVITWITGKQDFTVITMVKSHVSAEAGFLRKVLAVFEKIQISIESAPVTVDTFSIVVQTKKIERYLYEIVAELKQDLHLDDIQVESQQDMLAVVGRAMRQMPGMSGEILLTLGDQQINIRTINQACDEQSIVIGVNNQDLVPAIKAIYQQFISEERVER